MSAVSIQIRTDSNSLHIQGKGKSTNRPYGVAVSVASHPQVEKAINTFPSSEKIKSLYAGSGQTYAKATASLHDKESSVLITVNDLQFIAKSEPLYKFVQSMME